MEILAFPRVQLLDVAGPLQVFATANDLAAGAGAGAGIGTAPPYTPLVVAREARVVSSAGLELLAHPLPSHPLPPHPLLRAAADAPPVDTLMIAGGFGVYPACEDSDLIGWIRRRAEGARRVASVCSGAFLLASTGLLDGRRAVTHWGRCREFAARFPAVRVDPDPIFIQDGAFWTSAGVTAGIDLALALVEADLGRDMALAVARQLVVFLKRPGGQSQFSATLDLQEAAGGDDRFDRLHAWMADNVRGDLSVAALATVAGLSERTFLRRYRAATGITPARAVERVRVEAARRLLESGQPVKRVAERCGFGSEETLRRSFLRLLHTAPQAYRDRFTPP